MFHIKICVVLRLCFRILFTAIVENFAWSSWFKPVHYVLSLFPGRDYRFAVEFSVLTWSDDYKTLMSVSRFAWLLQSWCKSSQCVRVCSILCNLFTGFMISELHHKSPVGWIYALTYRMRNGEVLCIWLF